MTLTLMMNKIVGILQKAAVYLNKLRRWSRNRLRRDQYSFLKKISIIMMWNLIILLVIVIMIPVIYIFFATDNEKKHAHLYMSRRFFNLTFLFNVMYLVLSIAFFEAISSLILGFTSVTLGFIIVLSCIFIYQVLQVCIETGFTYVNILQVTIRIKSVLLNVYIDRFERQAFFAVQVIVVLKNYLTRT